MSVQIRKNDEVMVLTGKNRKKRGVVLSIDRENGRALVRGVNVVKRAVRRNRKTPQGGYIEQETPLALSNLALYCSRCAKAVRFRVEIFKDGSKARTCVKCQQTLGKEL